MDFLIEIKKQLAVAMLPQAQRRIVFGLAKRTNCGMTAAGAGARKQNSSTRRPTPRMPRNLGN
jgi:hypothetical protein